MADIFDRVGALFLGWREQDATRCYALIYVDEEGTEEIQMFIPFNKTIRDKALEIFKEEGPNVFARECHR